MEDLPEVSLSNKTDAAPLGSYHLSMVPSLDTDFVLTEPRHEYYSYEHGL